MIRNIQNTILLIIVLIAIGACVSTYVLYQANLRNKANARRWENNFIAQKGITKRTVRQMQLTKEELEQEKEIVKTLKKEGIREKDVEYVYRYKTQDTGTAAVSTKKDSILVVHDTLTQWKYFPVSSYYQEECMKIWTSYDPDYDTTYHQWEREQDIQVIGHQEREKAFRIWKWTIFRYGPKNTYVTVTDRCSQDTILQNQMIKVK